MTRDGKIGDRRRAFSNGASGMPMPWRPGKRIRVDHGPHILRRNTYLPFSAFPFSFLSAIPRPTPSYDVSFDFDDDYCTVGTVFFNENLLEPKPTYLPLTYTYVHESPGVRPTTLSPLSLHSLCRAVAPSLLYFPSYFSIQWRPLNLPDSTLANFR